MISVGFHTQNKSHARDIFNQGNYFHEGYAINGLDNYVVIITRKRNKINLDNFTTGLLVSTDHGNTFKEYDLSEALGGTYTLDRIPYFLNVVKDSLNHYYACYIDTNGTILRKNDNIGLDNSSLGHVREVRICIDRVTNKLDNGQPTTLADYKLVSLGDDQKIHDYKAFTMSGYQSIDNIGALFSNGSSLILRKPYETSFSKIGDGAVGEDNMSVAVYPGVEQNHGVTMPQCYCGNKKFVTGGKSNNVQKLSYDWLELHTNATVDSAQITAINSAVTSAGVDGVMALTISTQNAIDFPLVAVGLPTIIALAYGYAIYKTILNANNFWHNDTAINNDYMSTSINVDRPETIVSTIYSKALFPTTATKRCITFQGSGSVIKLSTSLKMFYGGTQFSNNPTDRVAAGLNTFSSRTEAFKYLYVREPGTSYDTTPDLKMIVSYVDNKGNTKSFRYRLDTYINAIVYPIKSQFDSTTGDVFVLLRVLRNNGGNFYEVWKTNIYSDGSLYDGLYTTNSGFGVLSDGSMATADYMYNPCGWRFSKIASYWAYTDGLNKYVENNYIRDMFILPKYDTKTQRDTIILRRNQPVTRNKLEVNYKL